MRFLSVCFSQYKPAYALNVKLFTNIMNIYTDMTLLFFWTSNSFSHLIRLRKTAKDRIHKDVRRSK